MTIFCGHLIAYSESLPFGVGLASMVLKKVKEQMGLQEARCLLVGAAPVHRDVLEFFMHYDVAVLELYGMSENTGPATSNTADSWRLGTVGKAFAGSKIKIHEPDENGEGEVGGLLLCVCVCVCGWVSGFYSSHSFSWCYIKG